MRDAYEEKLQSAVRRFEEEVDSKLPGRVHGVLTDNKKLSAENAWLKVELKQLKDRVTELDALRKKRAVEAPLERQERSLLVLQQTRRAEELRQAQEGLSALEARVRQLGAELEATTSARQQERREFAKQLSAEKERSAYRLRAQQAEMRQVRSVAKEVLRQRNDVETFLLAALHDVQAEVALEEKQGQAARE